MTIGTVIRFDSRRGYGFINPDDGGADVFVHQNNIVMEGFRYLRAEERVSYELEVGEKGMKAVSVTLLEPRPPGPPPRDEGGDYRGDRDDYRGDFGDRSMNHSRHDTTRRDSPHGGGEDSGQLDKMRRKQERLISLLVEKGVLQPGEIDAMDSLHNGRDSG